MKLRHMVLALAVFSTCNTQVDEPIVSSHRRAAQVDFFLKLTGIVGESQENKNKNPGWILLSPPLGQTSNTGEVAGAKLVTRCQSESLCNTVDVVLTKPADGGRDGGVEHIEGGWQVTGPTGPGGDPWHGELVVRVPHSGDGLEFKMVNLQRLTGENTVAGGGDWYELLPASEVSCEPANDCNLDEGAPAPAPEGGSWTCVPTCRPCGLGSKICDTSHL